MKKLIIAALASATFLSPAITAPAFAQSRAEVREQRRDVEEARQDLRQERRELQRDRSDWREGRNYDYNRPDRRTGGYDASRYYRDGSNYKERRLSRNDRVYRGNDGRYYCRRSDGTTGLIIGAIGGGVLGNTIANGQSQTLGTLLGAGLGAALGQQVDRGNARCR